MTLVSKARHNRCLALALRERRMSLTPAFRSRRSPADASAAAELRRSAA